jgi:predicted kinase
MTEQTAHARPTVHLLCGLNGAGKTTYARRLAEERDAVRFSLDEWMLRLHSDLRFDASEYGPLAERCKELIWEVARQVLALGHDVILDWNSWSRARRATWHGRAREAGYGTLLHYLDVPLDVAIARAASRAAAGAPGAHVLDAAGVRHLAAIFEVPREDEGLPINTVRYKHDQDG